MIRQPQRPPREALFALFFPEALVAQYADKSKSNLTWFFTSDARNKSVRRSLAALLRENARAVVGETHRKCHKALWPQPGYPLFDGAALRRTLGAARLPEAIDARWHILSPGEDGESRLDVFYGVDEAAALARMLLTLAVAGDVPGETIGEIWRGEGDGDVSFLRGDTSIPGRIRYCRMLDLMGRHERAFQGYIDIAEQLGRPAQTPDESALYCRMGEMLFTGEGCARDEKAAQDCDRMGALDANPRSWFQLAQHTAGSAARQALERAAELGYAPAIRQLGMAWYSGSARFATLRNPDTARRVFRQGLSIPGADGAFCAYMLGQICEAQGERDAAVNAYRIAQESGSAEAAERLSRLDWVLPAAQKPPEGRRAAAGAPGYCLVNGLDGCNRAFAEGLRGRWDVTVCGGAAGRLPGNAHLSGDGPEAALRALAEGVYWGGAAEFPPLAIALLSGDRQENLFQAVALLGELQRLAQSLGERAWDLVDATDIYVLADHDDAAPLLDAAFAGMGPLYFRLRLCDPALDAADRLFAAAPLFLPRLKAPEDAPVRLAILGCGDVAMAALRRAVALPMPEGTLSIDVYGEDAPAMERRFAQLCPGIAASRQLFGALPAFHGARLDEALIETLETPADYCVVAAGDDARNLRLATLLRGEWMKRRLDAERQPFIAVHTARPAAQWLAGSLPAGPDAAPGSWYGQYDLFPFGGLDMYAPRQLAGEALEKRARQAHMLFIGLPNTRDARHAAMGSYYRRQFNRDTARAAAQGLIYRMHLAGVSLPGWRLYGIPEEEARLGAEYSRWLKQEDHLQIAVRDEHARRCRMLLAQGWAAASAEDVAAYVRRGNPGHRLYPARLDPFICPWETLEDGELLARVREIVRGRFPEKSVPDPRRDEENAVRDTERLLDGGV